MNYKISNTQFTKKQMWSIFKDLIYQHQTSKELFYQIKSARTSQLKARKLGNFYLVNLYGTQKFAQFFNPEMFQSTLKQQFLKSQIPITNLKCEDIKIQIIPALNEQQFMNVHQQELPKILFTAREQKKKDLIKFQSCEKEKRLYQQQLSLQIQNKKISIKEKQSKNLQDQLEFHPLQLQRLRKQNSAKCELFKMEQLCQLCGNIHGGLLGGGGVIGRIYEGALTTLYTFVIQIYTQAVQAVKQLFRKAWAKIRKIVYEQLIRYLQDRVDEV